MKKGFHRVISLLMAVILVLSMTACVGPGGSSESTGGSTQGGTNPPESGNTTEAPTEGEESKIPQVDMEGFDFIIGDWWSAPVYEEGEPTTAWEQMVQEYHHELQEKMHFHYSAIGFQNMGNYREVLTNSFLANEPVCHAFQAETEAVIPMAAQGLLYDLSTLDAFDFEHDDKWSQKILDYFTINGKIYAARPSEDQPRLGILFNKRLFQEAGLDPNLPYQLQREGKWDWENFESICKTLCRDTNNDGVTDIYAYGGNDCEMMDVGIYGNGAMYVTRDENGVFMDGTLDPAFEEGLTWAVSLIQKGYVREISSGDAWDKAYTDFANGQTAMLVAQTWIISSYLSEMTDEFGYALLPAGPKGHMCTNMIPTPICIPACLDEKTANNVATIINSWYDTRKNIEGAEAMNVTFRDDYYGQFKDVESVDETVTAMVTDSACQVYDSYKLVPNFNYYDVIVNVANQSATPAEQIQAMRPTNQAAIDAANALFGN